jgi:hypothetical protein
MIKRIAIGMAALLTASLLISQSLADLSKQEKERREKLKGKSVRVITNRDLKPASKAGAVDVAPAEAAAPSAEGQGAPAAGETGAAEAEAAPGPPEEAPAQDLPGFATSVSSESLLVENPGLAVGPPDGRFAEISVSGVLDLEIDVNNGPGADLAVYATPPAKQIPGEESEDQLEAEQAAMWWGQFAYAVLGLDARGDWLEIGMGSGRSPDTFDLGALKSTTRILIMFKTYSNPYNQGPKPMRLSGREMTFGVDAVRALH